MATCAGMEGIFTGPLDRSAPRIGAVIVAGSGPTDANGNNRLSGRSDNLRLIAGALATQGIASIRYDKRGVGRSAAGAPPEAAMTIETSAEDAGLWVQWLSRRLEGRPVDLVGHSEGALIACLAAQLQQIATLVLLAAPGRPLGEILRQQIERHVPPDLAQKALTVLAELIAGRRVYSIDPALANLFRPSVQPFLISSLVRDPAFELASFGGPALIIGGGRDEQVSRDDFDALAAAKIAARALWLPTMNHMLKDINESAAASVDPALALASGLADAITAHILDAAPRLSQFSRPEIGSRSPDRG